MRAGRRCRVVNRLATTRTFRNYAGRTNLSPITYIQDRIADHRIQNAIHEAQSALGIGRAHATVDAEILKESEPIKGELLTSMLLIKDVSKLIPARWTDANANAGRDALRGAAGLIDANVDALRPAYELERTLQLYRDAQNLVNKAGALLDR